MHATHKGILIVSLVLGLILSASWAIAAPAPAAPPAEPAKPAAKAKAPTLRQYLSQLPPAEQAAAKAIVAKRVGERKALQVRLKAVGGEMKAMWTQPKFDQAQFAAKGKEFNELINKLGLLRLAELTELRARFGPQLPLPRHKR
ncbi:MAG: periplasmic heavy metal sensor [Pseudomonadota bacterium]